MLTDQGAVRERGRGRERDGERERVLEGSLTLPARPCCMEGVKCEDGCEVYKGCVVTFKQQNIKQIRAQMLQTTKHFIII